MAADLSTDELLVLLVKAYNNAANFQELAPKVDLILQNQERILSMANDFQSLLADVKAQGEQLDKVLLEVQAGNAATISPEQLQELKDNLQANQGKIQQLDDLHADAVTNPEQPTEPAPVDPTLPAEPEGPQEPTFPGEGGELPSAPIDPATGLPAQQVDPNTGLPL